MYYINRFNLMKQALLLSLCILASAWLISGCSESGSDGADSGSRLKVVATTGMIADAAHIIAGDSIEVVGLMGPGVDPHLYRASQNDLTLLSEADLILYNGLHLEGKMGDVLERLGERKPVVAVAGKFDPQKLRTPEEYEGNYDPHVWFDVRLWTGAVRAVGDAFAELDPDHSEEYRARTDAYIRELDSLDTWVRTEIATIPKESRVLVTAHDAFGYFGDAYDIEVRGLQGISTMSEFGVADINALVSAIVDRKVKAVFIESSVPRRNIDALVEGVKAKNHEVSIGGQLFSDAMGEAGTPEGTYVGMVRWNVNTIVEALR